VDGSATAEVGESLVRPMAAESERALPPRSSVVRQINVLILAGLLAVLTAATLAACRWALMLPGQLDEGEPLIYGLATRMLRHEPLYQPVDRQPYVQVHYSPLYYAAVALLHAYVVPGFAPGRVLSLAAGLVAAALVGYLTASLARSRRWWAAGFSALLFLGLGFPGAPAPFLVLERVDVLGVLFSIAAIAFLAHGRGRTHALVAGALAGLALLTKQSLFAAALAGAVWLATISWRKSGWFAMTTLMTALVPAFVLQSSSAGAFWDNIGPANPNSTSLASGAYLLKEWLALQGVPTLLALFYVVRVRAWNAPLPRLLMLYWLATFASAVGIIKVGANHNYWIELAAGTAVLASLAVWTCLRPRRHWLFAIASMLPVWLLALQLGVLTPARFTRDRNGDFLPLSWTLFVTQFADLLNQASAFNQLVGEMRAEHGVILAEGLDATALSDHPIQLEPFAFSMLEHERRWNSQPLVADICSGRIDLLVLSYPIQVDIHPTGLQEFPMFPASVMTALRQSMKLDRTYLDHWFYRPLASRDGPSIAQCEAEASAARAR